MAISLTEEYDDVKGRYVHYEAADVNKQADLLSRSHKNIRSFSGDADVIPRTITGIVNLTMGDLDPQTMADLESTTFTSLEGWTVGTFGKDSAFNNRSTLRLALPTGVTTTTSVSGPVDLSDFAPTDTISMSIAGFDPTAYNLETTLLRLSDGTQTVSLPFISMTYGDALANFPTYGDIDASAPTYQTLSHNALSDVVGGHAEVSWPLSALGTLTQPTTVEIVFDVRTATTLTVVALRVLTPDWTPAESDINTIFQRLEPTVDRMGNIPTEPFPKMWRASDTPGTGDPLPIDTKLGVNFYTGSSLQDNSISVFFRARREDYLTQLDLDGADVNSDGILEYVYQDDLDAYGVQPDYGRAMYNPQPQTDFDALPQTTLDTYTQAYMEREPDLVSEAWIEARLEWGTTNNFYLGTTEATITNLPLSLAPNTLYFANFEVINDAVRVRVYPLDSFGGVGSVIFDSQEIRDDFTIKRRKGRVGWTLTLNDGDAYVNSVRSRGLVFNEYISHDLESVTPVVGARLYVGATPDTQTTLATVAAASFSPATVQIDTVNARSTDGSAKVFASLPLTGVQSQFIPFEDFSNSEISFDLFYPQTDVPPQLYLESDRGLFIELGMPGFTPNTWNHISVEPLAAYFQQTGLYRIMLITQTSDVTFWIDNFLARQRAIRWSGRATQRNPWGRLRNQWGDFGSLLNSETDGILFPQRGNYLQIRGQALTQDATIDRIYAKPQYAELGRIAQGTEPITAFTPKRQPITVRIDATPKGTSVGFGGYTWPNMFYHPVGTELTFTATVTGSTDIEEYYWDFGDGIEISHPPDNFVNLVTNPSFENGTTGWSTIDPTWFLNSGAATTMSPTSYVGTTSVEITTSSIPSQGIATDLGVLPAGTYSFGVWVRGQSGGEVIEVEGGPPDGTGPDIQVTLTTSWQRVTGTFTANGVSHQYLVVRGFAATPVSFFIDAALVVSGNILPEYFDGDNHGTWSGTPNASTSVVKNRGTATHTYTVASPGVNAHCRIRDTLGREAWANLNMMLE